MKQQGVRGGNSFADTLGASLPSIVLGDAAPAFASCCLEHSRVSQRTISRERQIATGVVKRFSDEKGFAFITPDDQGKDLLTATSIRV